MLYRQMMAAAMLAVFCVFMLCACAAGSEMPFAVFVMDAGQGDAILIRSGDAAMLVDAGPNSTEDELLFALDELGVDRLDVVLFTHPDEDHIGGGDGVLLNIPVERMIVSPVSSDESTFLRSLEAAEACGTTVDIAEPGEEFALGSAKVTLLGPVLTEGVSSNDASIVVRVEFGLTAVLLMGDAELDGEAALLAEYPPDLLRADLIKLGHHGAATSTSAALLDAVCPAFAAISCGEGNTYGHPARSVVNRLIERGIAIGRTDRDGMLVYASDGAVLTRIK
ncbi:MAG: MBL fold metallo-hydrolase [Clostridia bacterium]|nr:MBL fold metallo-hydrolase [Clostridia bacterium]